MMLFVNPPCSIELLHGGYSKIGKDEKKKTS